MRRKIAYYFIGFITVLCLFGFSKKKKKIDKCYEKIDTSIYAYKCIYEVNEKADTFKYSVAYDDSQDSTLIIKTSYFSYGEPLIGYMLNINFKRNNKIIDTTFITNGKSIYLKNKLNKLMVKCYYYSDKFYYIPVDTIKFDKITEITLNYFDYPATRTTYEYRCKNEHSSIELKEIHNKSYPNTKSWNILQEAKKYKDTCDCKLESRDYKEF